MSNPDNERKEELRQMGIRIDMARLSGEEFSTLVKTLTPEQVRAYHQLQIERQQRGGVVQTSRSSLSAADREAHTAAILAKVDYTKMSAEEVRANAAKIMQAMKEVNDANR